jgi:hypothetical protein
MRARRSRSQHAQRWERGRPARNPDHARKKPTPLSLKVPPASRGNRTRARFPSRSGGNLQEEGNCKLRLRDWYKRRTWRTVHWAVDCASGRVMAVEVTEARVHDSTVVEPLLAAVECPLASVAADGAYNRCRVYAALVRHSAGVQIAIPPRRDARRGQHGNCTAPPHPRDETLRFMRRCGRRRWKAWCG